jgi:ankyrin repeat protein
LGHLDVVQLLLATGANPNLRDYTGRTALMWADWNRKSIIARILRKAGVRE